MQRYIDQRKLAGIATLVARRGRVVHFERFGLQDIEANEPIQLDTIFRIYSMSKPITSMALMMLYEHALFHLTDPVSKFIPEFKKVKVLVTEGELADLVLFDALTVADRATFTDPHQYPVGIPYVLVNGVVAIDQGQHTGALPGQVL